MEFQLSYSKSRKMMQWKCCTQYASKFGKLSSGHRTAKCQFSFQSQRKAMSKNVQTITQLHLSHMLASSFQLLSCVWLSATPCTTACQAFLSPTPGVYSKSCPLSQWCHSTIASIIPFSAWLQSFPVSGSFPMSHFFKSGGLSIGISTSSSVLLMNIQDWFPLRWTGWISSKSKGLSRLFSNTTVQKTINSSAQLSL